MIKADNRLLEAFFRLEGNPHHEVIMKWIFDSIEKYGGELPVIQSDVPLRQTQGKVQILGEIVGMQAKALQAKRQ